MQVHAATTTFSSDMKSNALTSSAIEFIPQDIFPIKPKKKEIDKQLDQWCEFPFVSNKSSWGKDEDEAGIYVKCWLPEYNVSHAVQGNWSVSHGGETFQITYPNTVMGACIEYEVDEEEEETFCVENCVN